MPTPPYRQTTADSNDTILLEGRDNDGHLQPPSSDQCLIETTEPLQGLAIATMSKESATEQSAGVIVAGLVADELHLLRVSTSLPDCLAEPSEVDSPEQFHQLQTTGVGAQVLGLVKKAIRWAEDLRRCLPPERDKLPALSAAARLLAEITQRYQKEHAQIARSVQLRNEKRKLELELAVVAEKYLRDIGFTPTDLCDLNRRVKLLLLQEGGRDLNGNWVNYSST